MHQKELDMPYKKWACNPLKDDYEVNWQELLSIFKSE